MPLLFKNLCDLLSDLESYSSRRPPLPPARREKLYLDTITQWFCNHNVSVDSPDVDPVILLSALLPARRTDRVYGLQAESLSRKLRRCLNLGEGRWQQLEQWKTPGRGDLGECVERVQRQAEFPVPPAAHEVTLEEVDRALANMAKTNRFSAPSVRAHEPTSSPADLVESLQRLYHRLQSREAKWLTRIILKEHPGLELKDTVLFRCLDVRLPAMMRNQDSFESAIDSLRSQNNPVIRDPHGGGRLVEAKPVDGLMPRVGIKVGRATYLKGRSVKQVVGMVTGRLMSVERKYDGEYCQIHIDLSKRDSPIQIFSKSGKDSTKDRDKLHTSIMKSLRIGSKDCGFTKACILEGEMVVWSDVGNKILPFCKLRKHVSRSGSFLGADMDSQVDPSEHLMIIFYDVLLIDDDPILKMPYYRRRKALERLVKRIKGRARLTTQKEIRFASPEGPKLLRHALALAFVRQWEGIVLKPLNDPYFRCSNIVSHEFASCWVKMKKDYIPGLGDTADFAVLGAGYCAREAAAKRIPNLKWTHFYIGCLRNKSDVVQFNAKPHFTIIDRVNHSMTPEDLISLNRLGQFRAIKTPSAEAHDAFKFDFQPGMSEMSVAFKEPFVFELLGAGFDRLPNQNLFTLRFPRVQKVHWDRDWKDAVSLEELQQLAVQARSAPVGDDLKEIEAWMNRLDQVDRGAQGAMLPWDDSQEHKVSQQSRPTRSPKSNRRTRPAVSSPMIRIDTAEMTSWEHRLESGEVVEGFDTPHSSAREMSEATPPPSSNSSSLSQLQTPDMTLETVSPRPSRQADLKRLANSDEDDPLRVVKKVKVQEDGCSIAQTPDMPSGMYQRVKAQPLNTVTNSACRRETARSRSPSASPRSKFSLVGEMAIALHDRINRIFQRPLDPLSPGHQKEVSPNNIEQTGQSTQHNSQPKKSPENLSLPQPKPNYTNLPSPPTSSLQDPTPRETMPTVQIPDITKCKVVLTPCVLELPYSLVTTILQPPGSLQPITAFWLPSADSLLGPLLTPALSHDQSLLVLADESHEEAMQEVVKTLIAFMPVWKPSQIAIWDWRFLRVRTRDGDGNGEGDGERKEMNEGKDANEGDQSPSAPKEDSTKKYFLANMVWAGEEGELEIQWRDGNTTRIASEKLKHP